ncbi:MAG: sigma-70 family RNA polymerase sigma factor [Verrucomicrobiota bacterium]|nr:sigma-70 family RNA polymerase sigma factor [Verrucomicrobiota bacterium]
MAGSAEQELIRRCCAGDAEAWDELFSKQYPVLCQFLFQVFPTFSREDAEEVAQEALITVIRTLSAFKGESQLQTWIMRIGLNKGRDFIEKASAQKRGGGQRVLSLEMEHPETGLRLDAVSDASGPDKCLLEQEQAQLLRAALDQLGDPCRELIELRFFADSSYEEIAAQLAMNIKTVSSRLSKCLDKLEIIVRPNFSAEKPGAYPSNI